MKFKLNGLLYNELAKLIKIVSPEKMLIRVTTAQIFFHATDLQVSHAIVADQEEKNNESELAVFVQLKELKALFGLKVKSGDNIALELKGNSLEVSTANEVLVVPIVTSSHSPAFKQHKGFMTLESQTLSEFVAFLKKNLILPNQKIKQEVYLVLSNNGFMEGFTTDFESIAWIKGPQISCFNLAICLHCNSLSMLVSVLDLAFENEIQLLIKHDELIIHGVLVSGARFEYSVKTLQETYSVSFLDVFPKQEALVTVEINPEVLNKIKSYAEIDKSDVDISVVDREVVFKVVSGNALYKLSSTGIKSTPQPVDIKIAYSTLSNISKFLGKTINKNAYINFYSVEECLVLEYNTDKLAFTSI